MTSEPHIPFLRRFTNEQQRDIEDAQRLYAWVKVHQDAFTETKAGFAEILTEAHFDGLPKEVRVPLTKALYQLLDDEKHIWELPAPAFDRMNLKEFVEYRNLLYAKQYFFTNQAELIERLYQGLVQTLAVVGKELPAMKDPTPFVLPLIYALPQPRLLVEHLFGTLGQSYDRGLFRKVSSQLIRNVDKASGREGENSKKLQKHASESTLPLDELADAYLAGTPFLAVFKAPVPLKLTHEDRFNHMHIVGGTGAGKTTLIENLILHDLQSDDPPGMVLIDPHGDLIKKLIHSDLGIEDRLIIIDPRDVQHPPALNIFAVNQDRLENYDEAMREQVTAGVIQTFDYLFSGLLGADLTAKQGVFFRYVARLMLALPETMGRNATILDMMRLMSDPAPYQRAIDGLPEIPREFFLRDFNSRTFAQTKEQIRYRLQAIIENPTMARLFTSTETKVDIFTELNKGSIILVDTAKDFLKDASGNFGRIFISLTLQAVLERAAIPAEKRKDAFLIVDEAASYFDSNIDDLLTEARKYRCGLVLAHQYLDQASGSLRASLAANTGIKFASGLSAADARSMATEMRTTPDFILNQPRLQFAAHIRNVTPQAVSIPIQPITHEKQLSSNDFEMLMARNRKRVSLPQAPIRARQQNAPSPQILDEDISPEW